MTIPDFDAANPPDRPVFTTCDLLPMQEAKHVSMKIKYVLQAFRQDLERTYGDRLVRVVLYGSYARGEETSESDVDVVVVLTDMRSPFDEIQTMSDSSVEPLLKYEELVSVVPMTQDKFLYQDSPLLRNVRQEGVIV